VVTVVKESASGVPPGSPVPDVAHSLGADAEYARDLLAHNQTTTLPVASWAGAGSATFEEAQLEDLACLLMGEHVSSPVERAL
jgi:hypothetical protein